MSKMNKGIKKRGRRETEKIGIKQGRGEK